MLDEVTVTAICQIIFLLLMDYERD